MDNSDELKENLENIFENLENHLGFTSTLMKKRNPAYKEVGESIIKLIESGCTFTVPEDLEEYKDVLFEHVKVVQNSSLKRERERSLIRIGRCAEPIYYTLKWPTWEKDTKEYTQKLKYHVDTSDIRNGTFYGFGKKRS